MIVRGFGISERPTLGDETGESEYLSGDEPAFVTAVGFLDDAA